MLRLSNGGKLIVGYDLDDEYSQISYCMADGDVETLSSVAGTENYNIPTVLCKREGVNQWFCGREALRYAEENSGILVTNLLKQAVDGETVQIEGRAFEPVALLTLFVRRSLGMLAQVAFSPDRIDAMMITCKKLNHRVLEVLSQVVAGLKLKQEKVAFQSYTECFYNYMIRQPRELWAQQALLCDYRDNHVTVYRMVCNRKTTPVVAFIDTDEHDFTAYKPMPESETLRRDKMERLDREFLDLMREVCEGQLISSVFLIGEDYSEEWMKESLRFLCRGRRVFQGNNMYSKGACIGMQERLATGETEKAYVFLENDKLKANVGMNVLRRGEKSYCALLDAGVNWFEAKKTIECYVQDSNLIEFVITPLIGVKGKIARILLDDLQGPVSRVQIHIYLREESRVTVEVKDLGLGTIRPGTGRMWREEIELY